MDWAAPNGELLAVAEPAERLAKHGWELAHKLEAEREAKRARERATETKLLLLAAERRAAQRAQASRDAAAALSAAPTPAPRLDHLRARADLAARTLHNRERALATGNDHDLARGGARARDLELARRARELDVRFAQMDLAAEQRRLDCARGEPRGAAHAARARAAVQAAAPPPPPPPRAQSLALIYGEHADIWSAPDMRERLGDNLAKLPERGAPPVGGGGPAKAVGGPLPGARAPAVVRDFGEAPTGLHHSLGPGPGYWELGDKA